MPRFTLVLMATLCYATSALGVELVVRPGKREVLYMIDGTAVSSIAALNVLNAKKVRDGDLIKIYIDDRLTFAGFEVVHGLVTKAGFGNPEYYIFKDGGTRMMRIERGQVELLNSGYRGPSTGPK